MSILKNTLLACVLIFPGALSAQQIVATDATSVAEFFRGEGVEPAVEKDNVGDPLINVDYYGSEFSIYFYGCVDGADCDTIQFFSGYKTNGSVRLSKINDWNTGNRYARAYNSEGGSARIEFDVYLGNAGVTSDDFASLVGVWVQAMKDFEEHIDW